MVAGSPVETVKIFTEVYSAHKYNSRHDQNVNLGLIKFYGFLKISLTVSGLSGSSSTLSLSLSHTNRGKYWAGTASDCL